jgi:hypothetical protein
MTHRSIAGKLPWFLLLGLQVTAKHLVTIVSTLSASMYPQCKRSQSDAKTLGERTVQAPNKPLLVLLTRSTRLKSKGIIVLWAAVTINRAVMSNMRNSNLLTANINQTPLNSDLPLCPPWLFEEINELCLDIWYIQYHIQDAQVVPIFHE